MISPALRGPSLGREQIIGFQNTRLRQLIGHAYEQVPYYRALFDRHHLKPRDISSLADLPAIPLTSRTTLQSLSERDSVANGVDPLRLLAYKTSGSSGQPLTIRRTLAEERSLAALRRRAMSQYGLRCTDKEASVRLVRPSNPWHDQLTLRILQRIGLFRRQWIDCRLPPKTILWELRKYRPDVLTGYPGSLSRLAQTINDYDRRLVRPRFVCVGGEVLTSAVRRQISQAFGSPVFDTYASFEFNLIAWECRETAEFHTCDDGLILEVLKDDGSPAKMGERGEVIGTNLHSFSMPFIRFRLGDMVTRGRDICPCGCPFGTIRQIHGRMIDYFQLPSGRSLHPYEIGAILTGDAGSWIRQFQVTQERQDRITLRVGQSMRPMPQQLNRLEASMKALLGENVEFRIIWVPEIELEASGKFRVYRSYVASAYDS
jgi:phenylacetate-CoA ligase